MGYLDVDADMVVSYLRRDSSNCSMNLPPGESIDFLDMAIMAEINCNEPGTWKKRIHANLAEVLDDAPSVQTVGRRVDELEDNGLLQATVTNPDGVKRSTIIGYVLNDASRELLETVGYCRDCGALSPNVDNVSCSDHDYVSFRKWYGERI